MSDPNEVSCANCTFFEVFKENENYGECRASLPSIILPTQSIITGAVWATVEKTKWCGCFVWNDLILRSQYKDVIATFRATWGLDKAQEERDE